MFRTSRVRICNFLPPRFGSVVFPSQTYNIYSTGKEDWEKPLVEKSMLHELTAESYPDLHIYKLVCSSDSESKCNEDLPQDCNAENYRCFFLLSCSLDEAASQQQRTWGLGGGSSGGISGSGCRDRILLDNSFLITSNGIWTLGEGGGRETVVSECNPVQPTGMKCCKS